MRLNNGVESASGIILSSVSFYTLIMFENSNAFVYMYVGIETNALQFFLNIVVN